MVTHAHGDATGSSTRRILGWVAIAALLGLAVLFFTLDVLDYAAGAPWKMAPLGQRWFEFHRNSLLLIQPAIERHIAVWLWPPIQWLLRQPAWLLPGGLALLLLLAKALRRAGR